jgi:hypothetical protein
MIVFYNTRIQKHMFHQALMASPQFREPQENHEE